MPASEPEIHMYGLAFGNIQCLHSTAAQYRDTPVRIAADFSGRTAVYPVCDGTLASVTSEGGLYTAEVEFSPTFTAVFTGLTTVYSSVGDEVRANIPFAYTDGASPVSVSMFDGDEVISNFSLDGALPVWNS